MIPNLLHQPACADLFSKCLTIYQLTAAEAVFRTFPNTAIVSTTCPTVFFNLAVEDLIASTFSTFLPTTTGRNNLSSDPNDLVY